MKGIPNEQTRKIPRGGLTRKPKPSLEEQAADLVQEADNVATRYVLTQVLADGTIADGVAYGYLLGQLRSRSKEIVAEALAQRFQMTDEEFATDILGG